MSVQIGDTIDGKYEIVRLLGEGGMGAVYEGMNTRIHRRVAIKVLHAGVADNEEAMKRFEREAQAAGRIGSEHIVEVLDLGDLEDGERYMVMEFLEGEALSDRIARGHMAPRAIAAMMVEMLEGLKAAHAAGIIHRDLKPDNVFLLANRPGRPDFVKIVDFGISKFNVLGGDMSMTRTGAVMGTPYYMAPEQAKGGKDVDHRADLYAVGVILYQAVVGQVPFDAATFNELLFKIVLEMPPPLGERVPGIDPSFVHLVEKAMAREPHQRFQSAQEFQQALQGWLGGAYIPAGRTVSTGTPHGLEKTALPSPGMPMATPFPQQAAASGTVSEWTRTGEGQATGDASTPPVKRGPNFVVLGGIVALLVAAGAAFIAWGGAGQAPATAEEGAAEQGAQEVQAAARAEAADAEREAATKMRADEKRQAEEARAAAEAAAAKDQGEQKPAERPSARPAPAPAPTAAPAPRPQPSPAPRPAAAPSAAPKPAPAPAPSSTTTSSGRTIRTDF